MFSATISLLCVFSLYHWYLFIKTKEKHYLIFILYLLSFFALILNYALPIAEHDLPTTANDLLINIATRVSDHAELISLIIYVLLLRLTNVLTPNIAINTAQSKTLKKADKLMFLLLCFAIATVSFINETWQHNLLVICSVFVFFYLICWLLIYTRRGISYLHYYILTISCLFLLVLSLYFSSFTLVTFTTNQLFIISMIHILLFNLTLTEYFYYQHTNKLNVLTQYQYLDLPHQINLEQNFANAVTANSSDLSVLVIRPDNFKRINLYIDEKTRYQIFQHLSEQINRLLDNNKEVIPLANSAHKVALIAQDQLAMLINNDINNDINNKDIDTKVIPPIVATIAPLLTKGIYIEQLALNLTAHIGLANYPEHGTSCRTLLNHAALAAKNALLQNKQWCYFTPLLNEYAPSSKQLAFDLKQALATEQLSLYHQPQIDLKTNRICSSECLLYWQHETLGNIDPKLMMTIAEDFGLINDLTQWQLSTAINQQIQVHKATGFNHVVAISISAHNIMHANFAEQVKTLITQKAIKAEKIILQLKQSFNTQANGNAIRNLSLLVNMGITISVSDFNSCYQAINTLTEVPIQELKLNQDVLTDLDKNHHNKVLIDTAITMAKAMKWEIVAEGVNSEHQALMIKTLACDIAQGDFYAKTMPLTDYIDWLAQLNNGQIPDSLEGEFIHGKH